MGRRRYARRSPASSSTACLRAGTTTALVFGAHFARPSTRCSSGQPTRACGSAPARGQRPAPAARALTTPERAYADGLALAARWNRPGGGGTARTAPLRRHPRFSLSASEARGVVRGGAPRRRRGAVHLAHQRETPPRSPPSRALPDYATTPTHTAGAASCAPAACWRTRAPGDAELDVCRGGCGGRAHARRAKSALGSGLFPLRRHVERGVPVARARTGGGTSFSWLREGLQAYLCSPLSAPALPLTARTCCTSRRAPVRRRWTWARGRRPVRGRQFDAVWVGGGDGGTLDVVLRHATDPDDALARCSRSRAVGRARGVGSR